MRARHDSPFASGFRLVPLTSQANQIPTSMSIFRSSFKTEDAARILRA